jgi:hypothetical protein
VNEHPITKPRFNIRKRCKRCGDLLKNKLFGTGKNDGAYCDGCKAIKEKVVVN